MSVPIFALLVSIAVAWIGYCQLKIASAKIRLDLYNRRFAVYVATLDLYQACWGKEGYAEVKGCQTVFIRFFRESQFLFEEEDGIYKTLERFKDGAAKVAGFKREVDEGRKDANFEDLVNHLSGSKRDGLDQIDESIRTLERQLARYLNFSDVEGWSHRNLKHLGKNVKLFFARAQGRG
jgi:hypothetical protein